MLRIMVLLLTLIFLFSPAISKADLVTEGYINYNSFIKGNGTFDLTGNDFHATGGFSQGAIMVGVPLPFTSYMHPVGYFVSGSDFGGSGSYESASTGELTVYWAGINGSSYLEATQASYIPLSPGTLTYTGTFSFEGRLFGTERPGGFDYQCIACLSSLEGSGIVTIVGTEILLGDIAYFEPRQAIYTFTNPVPVPSSILLFGSGLIGLAGYFRRKYAA